jgi:hypothetical protein
MVNIDLVSIGYVGLGRGLRAEVRREGDAVMKGSFLKKGKELLLADFPPAATHIIPTFSLMIRTQLPTYKCIIGVYKNNRKGTRETYTIARNV